MKFTINYENIKKNLIMFVISMLYMYNEVTLKIKQKFSEFFDSKWDSKHCWQILLHSRGPAHIRHQQERALLSCKMKMQKKVSFA